MAKNKILSTLLLISMVTSTILPTFAEVKIEDLNSPKDAFFRLGTTDIPENKIFTSEEIGKMTSDEFEDCEELINNQLKIYGIPKNVEAEEKVKAGELIWINEYTREDGTKVCGYYRRK